MAERGNGLRTKLAGSRSARKVKLIVRPQSRSLTIFSRLVLTSSQSLSEWSTSHAKNGKVAQADRAREGKGLRSVLPSPSKDAMNGQNCVFSRRAGRFSGFKSHGVQQSFCKKSHREGMDMRAECERSGRARDYRTGTKAR